MIHEVISAEALDTFAASRASRGSWLNFKKKKIVVVKDYN
jgi:hypothetical protein